jgi:hypothetical protein
MDDLPKARGRDREEGLGGDRLIETRERKVELRVRNDEGHR